MYIYGGRTVFSGAVLDSTGNKTELKVSWLYVGRNELVEFKRVYWIVEMEMLRNISRRYLENNGAFAK